MAAQQNDTTEKYWTKIWLMIGIAGVIASMAMQWEAFATKKDMNDQIQKVNERVENHKKEVAETVEKVKEKENEHYVELLKQMNEIKLILSNKANRKGAN